MPVPTQVATSARQLAGGPDLVDDQDPASYFPPVEVYNCLPGRSLRAHLQEGKSTRVVGDRVHDEIATDDMARLLE